MRSRPPEAADRGGSREAGARRDLLLAAAAPALLVCVALLQLYLSHNHDLSPWKGGGFGMFASVDRVEHRVVRVAFEGMGRLPVDVEAFADISFPHRQLVDRALSMPTEAALEGLADGVEDVWWTATSEGLLTPDVSSARAEVDVSPEDYPTIAVGVWRVQYDAERDLASPELLRSHILERRS